MEQKGAILDISKQHNSKHNTEGMSIVWKNLAKMVYIHLFGIYGIYLGLTGRACFRTFLFRKIPHQQSVLTITLKSSLKMFSPDEIEIILAYLAEIGVTAGAHRLWSHRSYKATFPLRAFLMILHTMANQNSIYDWARDHRVHHKFTDTNADPYNSSRGFIFSHVGWTVGRKHEDVKAKGKLIHLEDLKTDSVVMFQKKHYDWLSLLICYAIPWFIPVWFWGENSMISWNLVIMRYMLTLNAIWCINSFAHIWGHRPYDRKINPAENKFASIVCIGEGWHNYHHIFPWDYKAAELPTYSFNWTTGFIDFFAWIGWAYELKTVPEKHILQRANRTGDGSYPQKQSISDTKNNINEHGQGLLPSWGWNDEDMSKEDKELAVVLNKIE